MIPGDPVLMMLGDDFTQDAYCYAPRPAGSRRAPGAAR